VTSPPRLLRFTTRLTGVVAVSLIILVGCAKPPAPAREAAPTPVSVATATTKTVPVQIRTIGSVKPLATVSIRPQVGGQLTGVHFKEGESVTKGQKLFTIDPRPYEAAVRLAEATQSKSETALKGAQRTFDRLQTARGGAAGVELDAARTAVEGAQATVEVDKSAVDTAKLQLGYTTISSPLDGRVGELLVNQGNQVDANAVTPLAVINQVSPIAVTFSLPEPQLPAVAAARRQGPVKVEAYLRDGQPAIPGVLAFIDNAVNTTSGTVLLKGEFPNTDRKLWPGQFVDVVLTVRERPDSVVVPVVAVQTGQSGPFVFVVTADNKAEQRPVTVEFEAGNEAVIAKGLAGGERVVTAGQLRLVPGAAVSIKKDEPSAPAGGKE
jgi:multidrug efflux system membrane fusion protein